MKTGEPGNNFHGSPVFYVVLQILILNDVEVVQLVSSDDVRKCSCGHGVVPYAACAKPSLAVDGGKQR